MTLTVNSITSSEDLEGNGCGKPTATQGPDCTGVGLTNAVLGEPATVTVTPSVRAERCGVSLSGDASRELQPLHLAVLTPSADELVELDGSASV